jgi:DNA-binding NtrC family response regulator
MKYRLLVVDDESSQRDLLAGYLNKQGYAVKTAESGERALNLCLEHYFEAALIDLKMPEMDGLELLGKLKSLNPEVQVLMLTAHGSVESAVSAMRAGAFHYVNKPVDLDELLLTLKSAIERHHLLVENRELRTALADTFQGSGLIAESPAMKEVLSTVSRVAPSPTTVLIRGESGTGKEVVARAIHAASGRTADRFVAVNVAALPETLLDSELFGFERGAFTGAVKKRMGRFELADSGTLFLDEIGDLPAPMQVKLLRALEQKKIERLGGEQSFKVDVRLISATHVDLEARIALGTFREDLFYRLNVITVLIPPLRDRREDIVPLVEHFLERQRTRLGKTVRGLTREARDLLFYYPWPGNVRELENVIERACVLCRGDAIDVGDLPRLMREEKKGQPVTDSAAPITLRELEKSHIEKVLVAAGWNFRQAADDLGIHRNTLRMKIKEYGLERADG